MASYQEKGLLIVQMCLGAIMWWFEIIKKENFLLKEMVEKTGKFCFSPKIHKENNPGRLVVNWSI